MYKICVYAPENSVEKIKQALFDAGAGKIGNYDSCCWQTDGVGQFRPLDGSSPAIGSLDEIERVREVKVEMVCADDLIKDAVQAIKDSHPYETPAFDVLKIHNVLSY
ncbi:Bsu YqfO NIF3/CutA domain [hydrothermal vent metagenome]|uniref:Bsu YqfO NIF3/CutA domain n=1 Tax=hydrothermal vent metagenome TaxID=652676 RepID=A0A3B0W4Y4_9ZZZZ